MDVSLLKFMNSRVRIETDIDHKSYPVIGIDWLTDLLLLSGEKGNFWYNPSKVEIILENDENGGAE